MRLKATKRFSKGKQKTDRPKFFLRKILSAGANLSGNDGLSLVITGSVQAFHWSQLAGSHCRICLVKFCNFL